MKAYKTCALALVAVLAAGVVLAEDAHRVYLCPGHIVLAPGVRQRFQVYDVRATGDDLLAREKVTWAADPNAGTITETGLFTATGKPGIYANGARATMGGGRSVSAVVEIADGKPVDGYTLMRSWGDVSPGQFRSVNGLAVDQTGNIYAADSETGCVQKFDASGNFLTMWAIQRVGKVRVDGPLYIDGPTQVGLTTDADGNLYVPDTGNHRILKFDSSSRFLMQFGSLGTDPGQFYAPSAVVLDSSGEIYVVDTGNHRIQVFDKSGRYLRGFGSFGHGDGQFRYPTDLALGPCGNLYVADARNRRIQVFDPSGKYISQWALTVNASSAVSRETTSIEMDGHGHVYVATFADVSLREYDLSGKLMREHTPASDPQVFASCVALAPNGDLYVGGDTQVSRLGSADLAVKDQWGSRARYGQFLQPESVATDQAGNLYALDNYTGRIQKFGPDGSLAASWIQQSKISRQSSGSSAIAVGPDGNVYSVDGIVRTIVKYDSSGNYIAEWGSTTGGVQLTQPRGLAIDAKGYIYVADVGSHSLKKLDASGQFVAQWQFAAPEQGKGDWGPGAVAVDRHGNVYVANGDEIQVLDPSGKLLRQWQNDRQGHQYAFAVSGLAVDSNGNVFTTQEWQGHLYRYSPSGKITACWADAFLRKGGGTPFASRVAYKGIAVDSQGTVYAADYLGRRIQVFEPAKSSAR